MSDFWVQIFGGAAASTIGGAVGFLSAYWIFLKQSALQKQQEKTYRLFDALSKLHGIYTSLLHVDFPERKLTKRDYATADLVASVIVIDHTDLWEQYGIKFHKRLTLAFQADFDSPKKHKKAFKKFDSALVDFINAIQNRLQIATNKV